MKLIRSPALLNAESSYRKKTRQYLYSLLCIACKLQAHEDAEKEGLGAGLKEKEWVFGKGGEGGRAGVDLIEQANICIKSRR
jgi:hypothetical protein